MSEGTSSGRKGVRVQKYIPAVGPRLKKLLYVVLGLFSLLFINGAYLVGITIAEWSSGETIQNYFASWNFGSSSESGSLQVISMRQPEATQLPSPSLEPQLVIHAFEVKRVGDNAQGFLLVGNLHIRTPQGKTTPSKIIRQRMTYLALQRLQDAARDFRDPALLLVGDFDLSQERVNFIA